jgi:DNA-binding GntR family transcriptional regulator
MNPKYMTKKDLVVERIREAIVSGEIEPGERILQEELARRLNVSPTPVREALQHLQAEGILEHSPHKGVRVAERKAEDVIELNLIRSVLERLATELAVPRMSDAEIVKVRQLHEQIADDYARGELKELRRMNYEMHMQIYQAAQLPELFEMIRNLWAKYPAWTQLPATFRPNLSDLIAEHQQIVDAIVLRDAALAAEQMHSHVTRGMTALAAYRSTQGAADSADSAT